LTGIILTKNSTFIIGPVAQVLGYLMEGIFWCLDKIGIPNVGLSIILFTIIIYFFMLPLTIKQQKFSKLSAKMNPELQAIQSKYKNKKDNESAMAMQQETKAVYAKYGVSPSGSCIQLIIQMPILFALYRVIYDMPAYIGQLKNAFFPLVDNMIAQAGSNEFIQTFSNAKMYSKQFTNELFVAGNTTYVQNTFIDVLNKASSTEWLSIYEKFPNLSTDVNNTLLLINKYNNFLGLNIGNSPSYTLKQAWTTGSWGLIIGAIMIPLLSALTQWLNVKLMPQPDTSGNSQDNPMASSMKTMNMMMPLMSAFFCFTLPAGMGLYWIAGALVRTAQQVFINKHIDKMDMDEVIRKNAEKNKKKLEKAGLVSQTLNSNARINTKNVSASPVNEKSQAEKDAALKKATEYYSSNAKAGSIAAKANMVKQYNEKNNK